MECKTLDIFKEAINKVKSVVITTHIHPDGDGIGSQVALCLALRELKIQSICVNEEPLFERYQYLDARNTITSHDEYIKTHDHEKIDLFIVVDTNSPDRIGHKMKSLLRHARKILFVDHHPCSKAISAIHCIDTTMAATGQLVGTLIHKLKIPFTKEIALPLYTSILIDTSSFRYPTVTGDTHKILGMLLDTGIAPPNAYNKIYGTKKISHMHLLGKILSTAKSSTCEKLAWITVEEEDVEKFDSDHEDTHGFINHLLILDNVKVAIMFRNVGHQVKVSLRSGGDVDVGEIAIALGGGGHDHSAATIIEGDLKKVVPYVIKRIEKILED